MKELESQKHCQGIWLDFGAEELMTDIELVADYMNDKLAYTIDEKTNTDWQDTTTAKKLLDAGQISEEVYNEIKSGYSIFTTTAF